MVDGLEQAGYHVETMPMMRFERTNPEALLGWRPSPGTWCLAIAARHAVVARRELSLGTVFNDPARERHALALDLDVRGAPLRVVGLHTSSKLWWAGPVVHLSHLRRALVDDAVPTVLAGDFNLWGPPVERLLPGWRRTVRGRTYPAHRPHSQIDHILVKPPIECRHAEVVAPIGSDHRPVRARLAIPSPSPSSNPTSTPGPGADGR